MFDALKRKQLDDRRSADRDASIFHEVSEQCNNLEWAPVSIKFQKLHRKFSEDIDLSLPDDAIPMSSENAEQIIRDMMSKYKKGFEGWRASGNGQEGLAVDGTKIRLLLNGTDYEHIDNTATVHYVDDDRFKFCDNNLSVAYLWGYLELIDLTTFVVQNIKRIGLVSGQDVASARSAKTKSLRSSRNKNAESIQILLDQLPTVMEKAFASMVDTSSDEKRLIQCEDQLRKAVALYNTWYVHLFFEEYHINLLLTCYFLSSNDYEEAVLDHALYESKPDKSEQVLGIYDNIVDRKLARVKVCLNLNKE